MLFLIRLINLITPIKAKKYGLTPLIYEAVDYVLATRDVDTLFCMAEGKKFHAKLNFKIKCSEVIRRRHGWTGYEGRAYMNTYSDYLDMKFETEAWPRHLKKHGLSE